VRPPDIRVEDRKVARAEISADQLPQWKVLGEVVSGDDRVSEDGREGVDEERKRHEARERRDLRAVLVDPPGAPEVGGASALCVISVVIARGSCESRRLASAHLCRGRGAAL